MLHLRLSYHYMTLYFLLIILKGAQVLKDPPVCTQLPVCK